jgi:hypothetical protein
LLYCIAAVLLHTHVGLAACLAVLMQQFWGAFDVLLYCCIDCIAYCQGSGRASSSAGEVVL